MKKLTTNSKLIGCLMGLSIVALGTGCTDSDYDLSSVDSTIGVGGDGLELPTSSTENIILDDVLKLNNSDFVKIAANGDYMFNKDGDEATPSHPYINKIWVEKANVNNNFRLHITLPSQSAGARRTKLSNPVTAEGKLAEFHYTGASREGTMELGKSYTIQPAYSIMAPLAFDEGARIVYNDTIDGWTDDLEDIDLMAGSAIELTANVENKIPAYLTVSATAIDVQGKPIPENRIKVEVSNVINASEDGNTPVVTPLKIRLTEGEPGSVALVDGLTFRIEAASGEEGAKSIVGQTINAYNHTLKARDIKVRLVGKIIVNKD